MPYCPSPSQAVVDLAAIVHNLGQVREQAGGRQVMFAVKGDGYGHGASQCALEAQRTNAADWFAVANVAEGQELIAAGITRPILKLSPALPHDLDAAVTSGMRLTVTDDTNIAATGRSARRLARTVKVHIGVDTVKLGGEGFTPLVEKKQTVAAGDPLAEVDFAAVADHGVDTTVITTVVNSKKLGGVNDIADGTVAAGDPILEVHSEVNTHV